MFFSRFFLSSFFQILDFQISRFMSLNFTAGSVCNRFEYEQVWTDKCKEL